jgi:hypothetical protein
VGEYTMDKCCGGGRKIYPSPSKPMIEVVQVKLRSTGILFGISPSFSESNAHPTSN